jgi:phospho-N-acetylmuramoyl-pentapeptide-transferase
MIYYFINWLNQTMHFPGGGVFQFITFRALLSITLSLAIALIFGKRIIIWLQNRQMSEGIRDLGLQGEDLKKGTPTMGGIIILLAIIVPTLLFARLENVYILLVLTSTIWCGFIGYYDDYLKQKFKNKDGLSGKFKLLGQVGLGAIVGLTMYFNDNVYIQRETTDGLMAKTTIVDKVIKENIIKVENGKPKTYARVQSPVTTVPFFKNHEFNYAKAGSILGQKNAFWLTPLLYVLFVMFIIAAVSNGANITDGLDGLATGTCAIMCICFGVFAYLSGNLVFAKYLNIMHIPNLGELSIFIAAMIGACIGFLWYNNFPAQVFMGDTGSLALGGILGSLAIIVRKEFLLPVICFVFFIQLLSVMGQTAYFKWTRKKTGVGKRILLMAPLHHHYQKLDYHESKIVVRFWIITLLCAVLSIVTLKLQ